MSYEIEIVRGDITRADTEVIVNAANNHFWMGSGVAGAIKAAGGEIIEKEAVKKGPVMPGEAVHTTAGKLPFKMVIHAAVMGQDLHTSDKYIRQATISCLNLAEKLNIESIAFPAFGTGVGGFPMKACAHVMLDAVRGYQPLAKNIRRVQFCLFDEYGHSVFRETLYKKDHPA
ncbi:MAG: macro domain-containing protein [Candidatus Zixiibacteriota bacterium]|nr:MAG: macro domain-containing protein [candidate division Zixibacteria bacterium]